MIKRHLGKVAWAIAILFLLGYEFFALAKGYETLSHAVWQVSQGWPIFPFLAGMVIGGLAVHFWWFWNPVKKALVLILLLPTLASAQNLPNPRLAEWTASIDHATITSYELGFFLAGATSPVSIVDAGKPGVDIVVGCSAPTPCIQYIINVMPLAFNEYTAKVRAKAGILYSEWSDSSNPFQRVPGKPGKIIIK